VCVCVCVCVYSTRDICYECHHQTGIGFHEANILKGASIQSIEEEAGIEILKGLAP